MKHIEEKLQEYALLPPEEQAAVEAYVASHPEWQPLLEEGQLQRWVLEEARAFARPPFSDEALAHFITTRAFSHHPPPPALREWFAQVEKAIAEDADVRARYEQLHQRLAQIETFGTAEHFERVTGKPLPKTAATDSPPMKLLRGTVEQGYQRLAEPSRVHVLRPWLLAAAVVLVAVYGVLFWAGNAMESPLERMARLTPGEARWSAPSTRGAPQASESARLIEEAVSVYEAARVSTLGLFPHYDRERLHHAETLLQQALAKEATRVDTTGLPDTLLGLEALYFNGKVNLALGHLAEARASFERVVEGEGPHAASAARLLAAIQTEP